MKGVKAILLASGTGERFGDPLPKQFHLLAGKPVYQIAVEKLLSSNLFEEIILVCHPDWIDRIETSVTVIPGGKTRQKSSHLGLLAAGQSTEIVLIHDAVRPFVSTRILKENIEMAKKYGACDTCIPSADTLVETRDGTTLSQIPNRAHFRRGQTPQTFKYPLILEAHQKATQEGATDDCQLVLDLGHSIRIVEGDEQNIKITSSIDLIFAEAILCGERDLISSDQKS